MDFVYRPLSVGVGMLSVTVNYALPERGSYQRIHLGILVTFTALSWNT